MTTANSRRSGDKVSLSRNRRLRQPGYRETPDVVEAVCRLVRAVGKRVAEEDDDGLRQLERLDAELEVAWSTAIAGLRRTGYSDREIGEALGVSKQAVAQRWPRQTHTEGTAA